MQIEEVRALAMSLPEATEEPHFELSSFRIRRKIFATVPPDGGLLHIFVGDEDRERVVAMDPAAFETLIWGSRAAGIRVKLEAADPGLVSELLYLAWSRKAPKKLVATTPEPGYPQTKQAK